MNPLSFLNPHVYLGAEQNSLSLSLTTLVSNFSWHFFLLAKEAKLMKHSHQGSHNLLWHVCCEYTLSGMNQVPRHAWKGGCLSLFCCNMSAFSHFIFSYVRKSISAPSEFCLSKGLAPGHAGSLSRLIWPWKRHPFLKPFIAPVLFMLWQVTMSALNKGILSLQCLSGCRLKVQQLIQVVAEEP